MFLRRAPAQHEAVKGGRMNRHSNDRRIYFIAALVGAALGVAAALAVADECNAILPRGAVATGEPYLCVVSGERYACRDYLAGDRGFRVLFRGGPVPRQVYELTIRATPPTQLAIGGRQCELTQRTGVPEGASYRGTGVCEDEAGKPLPCSLYEHAAARAPEAMRYLAFYEPDGNGIRHLLAFSAGRNAHAFEAELAFHLGQALAGNACCRDQAQAYVAYAAALFPSDPVYRAALLAFASPTSVHTAASEPECIPGETWPSTSR
jgi:hypothetical protein